MKNIIGETYNQLTVIEDLGINKSNKNHLRIIKCKCSCGNMTTTNYRDVKRGHTRSCGCFRKSEEVLEKLSLHGKKMQQLGKLNIGYNRVDDDTKFRYYIKQIKRRQKSSALTIEDLRIQWNIQQGVCVYTNIPLILANHTDYDYPRFMQASVDRINSDLGYEVGNIQFVSITCNYAKNAMTHDEMKTFIDIIKFGYENLI